MCTRKYFHCLAVTRTKFALATTERKKSAIENRHEIVRQSFRFSDHIVVTLPVAIDFDGVELNTRRNYGIFFGVISITAQS